MYDSLKDRSVVGVILAGGQSRRMEGREKAFITLKREPLLEHVRARLAPQVSELLINANGDPDRFSRWGLPVVPDLRPGWRGPLAGIEAAFAATDSFWLLTVAVDLPFLPRYLVVALRDALEKAVSPAVAESQGRLHPTVALWPRTVAPAISEALDADQRGVTSWLAGQTHIRVSFPVKSGKDPFFNMNTPFDEKFALKRLEVL